MALTTRSPRPVNRWAGEKCTIMGHLLPTIKKKYSYKLSFNKLKKCSGILITVV